MDIIREELWGLTSAAGIRMTAAVGLGSLGVAILGTLFTIILSFAGRVERRVGETRNN